jgi:5-methylcytosine-specific restriction endonuclease McrA
MTVGEIRHLIYLRQDGHCISCGENLTEDQFHMHEKIFRGHGGKISLDNSEGLCYDCHLNRKTFGHGKRKPQFLKKKVIDGGAHEGN